MSFLKYLLEYLYITEISQNVLNIVINKFIKQGNDEVQVNNYVNRFNELYTKGKIRGIDITAIKNFKELQNIVDKAEITKSKSEITREVSSQKEEVYEDDNYLVISPLSYESSCKYGKGTKWCISSINDKSYWYDYRYSLIKFYFIFDKNKDINDPLYKVAVAVYYYKNIEIPEEYKNIIKILPNGHLIAAYNSIDENINPVNYIKNTGLSINIFKPMSDNEIIKTIKENPNKVLENAFKFKNKKVIKMAIINGAKPNEDILNYFIKTKNKEIIKLILDAGVKPNEDILNLAIKTEDKEIVKLVLDAGAKPNEDTLNNAIYIYDKEIIKRILDAGVKPNEDVLDFAVEIGDKEIVKLVLDAGAKPGEHTLKFAVRTRDKEIIKWVLDAGAKPDEHTLNLAIGTRDKEIIKWLLDAGAKPDENALNFAIGTRDKEIIKWVLDAGAKPNKDTLDYAISTKDKEIIDLIKNINIIYKD